MELVLDDLACERGGRWLFSGLSRVVGAGRSLLIKGPNGAGKTTLLKTIAGLLPPAAGRIALAGAGAGADAPLAEQCHLIGHASGVKRALTVRENYAFWRAFLADREAASGAARDGLDALALDDLADLPAGVLSAGQRRRLALARLHAAPRPLWLLDEPAEALDQTSKRLLAAMIKEHAKAGGIVLAVSHIALGLAFDETLILGAARAPKAPMGAGR